MTRALVEPPPLSPAALAELKAWLGITTTRDDGELTSLLRAGLDLCEAFTGSLPLVAKCEDQFVPGANWQLLSARPVQSIACVEAVGATGVRVTLPVADYAIDLDGDGSGRVRLFAAEAPDASGLGGSGWDRSGWDRSGWRIAVRYTAGLAAEWELLPMALRQGLIRLAAHEHRQRDGNPATSALPAAVAALWRPFRRMRVA